MKLLIQIPCLNEAEQLPRTLAALPRTVRGFDTVEWLIVDDGSTDDTAQVARVHGVDHIVRLSNNKGLAAAFQAGLDASLKLGAHVIVNTDADDQYLGADIEKLVVPILGGRADMVVGDRGIADIEHFSGIKKRLQRLGSAVVRRASGTTVPDTASGFRAYNREAALQLQVVSKFTYTLETIIQAGRTEVALDHVPIRTNPSTRKSRLFPSLWTYVRRNALAILRVFTFYEPLRAFLGLALVVGVAGLLIWGRFLFFYLSGEGAGHVQSLVLGAALLVTAVQLAALGILGDVLAGSRVLQQRILERVRRLELHLGVEPSHYEPGSGSSDREPTVGAQAPPHGGRSSETQPTRSAVSER